MKTSEETPVLYGPYLWIAVARLVWTGIGVSLGVELRFRVARRAVCAVPGPHVAHCTLGEPHGVI